jgi:hypothetical protein
MKQLRMNAQLRLRVRTQLHAGGVCKYEDTNCILLDQTGKPLDTGDGPIFNTCHIGYPGAGAGCIIMKDALRDSLKISATCMQC